MNLFTTWKRIIPATIFAIATLTMSTHAALVTISPATSEIGVGEILTLDLGISGLTDEEDLGGFELRLNYDPTIFEFVSFVPGDWMTNDDIIGVPEITAGKVDLAVVSMAFDLSGQEDAFSIGSVQLKGKSIGISEISLSDITLAGGWGDPLDVSVGPAVTASVPEPAMMSLLTFGLLGMTSLSIFRKKNSLR
jgi:hypothetical protein